MSSNKSSNVLNNISFLAIEDLNQYKDSTISADKIYKWLQTYNSTYNSFNSPPDSKRQLLFRSCYDRLWEIYRFFKMEDDAYKAIQEFKIINSTDESQLLKWLVDNEVLGYNLINLYGNVITEGSLISGQEKITKELDVYFKTEMLQNCLDFYSIFDKYYYAKLIEYNTFSKEEQEEMSPFDDNHDNYISLKYHLDKRGILV